ncbi:MAG TPA: helix-hairpin-helix domain-containing protein [Promineifilum sp.]|nr:helix-hairpin-helix domain-containing protein [Promineifilum sp.]
MSKLLSPKAWYLLGIGATALALDGARRWVKKRRLEAERIPAATTEIPIIPFEPQAPAAPPAPSPVVEIKPQPAPGRAAPAPDDLTAIKGIGPTYARRLAEAGITTFAAIAAAAPDHLREVTKASAMVNPEEWIAQARSL